MTHDPEKDRVLLVNKPYQWTSFDVVNKLRRLTGIKKIGHAGTLDPLATGLLIICTGVLTREIAQFQDLEKEYTGIFTIGKTTASYDLETAVEDFADASKVAEAEILAAAAKFTGAINQVPPPHSAIKVGGKRAYELARKGKEVKLEPRPVTISTFEITAYQNPEVYFRIVCSKGTYIRSLARDFGESLGVGAYLSQLCRTRIGSYQLKDAATIEQLQEAFKK